MVLLAEVTGHVWGAVHAEGLEGYRLLVVRPLRSLDRAGGPPALGASELVVADGLGAGPGEHVLVATGSRVRDLIFGATAPFKSLVVAIVDGVDAGVADAG